MTTPPNTSWSGDRRSFPTKTARQILTEEPVCAHCGMRASVIADHVVCVAEARRSGWSEHRIHSRANGQGLCDACHDVKTREEQRRGRERVSRRRQPEAHPNSIKPQ